MKKLIAATFLLCSIVTAQQDDWKALSTENLDDWRAPLGDWMSAKSIGVDPENPKAFAIEPGAGIAVNGIEGRTEHLISKHEHGDIQAHIEFAVPEGSNSGVYFMGRYEIQVLDSWGETDLAHSDCGGIYERNFPPGEKVEGKSGVGGMPPRVNASKKPGEWQTFDVIFRAPRFDEEGNKIANALFVEVKHNGILIHENVEAAGPTRAALYNDEKPTGPIMLQGDHGPVAYRNIRIKPLDD